MSKVPSQALFHLIKALNKLEKRYFKLYSSRHVIGEKNNYVRIFDLIDKQSLYDESAILEKASISKKQLENYKRHLYELILKEYGRLVL